MRHIETEHLQRINKKKARHLYEAGQELTLMPCKANPRAPWFLGLSVQIDRQGGREFDSLINEFEHYNCNSEMGYYTSFYIAADQVAR